MNQYFMQNLVNIFLLMLEAPKSFNCINSTSLSFSEFSELFTSILLLAQHISKIFLHFHLPGGTSDIIMSVLHESLMFIASLCILGIPWGIFSSCIHKAPLGSCMILAWTSSDWSRGFSFCYHSKIEKHIAISSSLTSSLFLYLQCPSMVFFFIHLLHCIHQLRFCIQIVLPLLILGHDITVILC